MRWILVCTLACVLTVSCRTQGGASADHPFDREAIEKVLRAQQAGWNRGNVNQYMSAGYWQSPELVFISGGTITRGFQPVLERYKQNYQGDGLEMGHLDFSELEIEPLGAGYALARGRWDLRMKSEKKGGRYSLILERLPEGWRIVQDHSSADGK